MVPIGMYQMLTAQEDKLMSLHAFMYQTPELLFPLSLAGTQSTQKYISSLIAL